MKPELSPTLTAPRSADEIRKIICEKAKDLPMSELKKLMAELEKASKSC
jgi:hypothetical protein